MPLSPSQRIDAIISRYPPNGIERLEPLTGIPAARWRAFLGGEDPSLEELKAILFATDHTGEWLLTGEGERLYSNQVAPLLIKSHNMVHAAVKGKMKDESAITRLITNIFHAATSGARGKAPRPDALSFAQRISMLVARYGSQDEFAAETELSTTRIGDLLEGTPPTLMELGQLVRMTDVNADWLLTGQGELLSIDLFGPLLTRCLSAVTDIMTSKGHVSEEAMAKLVTALFNAELARNREQYESNAPLQTIVMSS